MLACHSPDTPSLPLAVFTIRNAYTGATLHTAPTLAAARVWCGQYLHHAIPDREAFLSGLAAGLVKVYDAHATANTAAGPGF